MLLSRTQTSRNLKLKQFTFLSYTLVIVEVFYTYSHHTAAERRLQPYESIFKPTQIFIWICKQLNTLIDTNPVNRFEIFHQDSEKSVILLLVLVVLRLLVFILCLFVFSGFTVCLFVAFLCLLWLFVMSFSFFLCLFKLSVFTLCLFVSLVAVCHLFPGPLAGEGYKPCDHLDHRSPCPIGPFSNPSMMVMINGHHAPHAS